MLSMPDKEPMLSMPDKEPNVSCVSRSMILCPCPQVESVSDLIAFLPDNVERVLASTSSVRGTEQVLPTAMIRYMVVVVYGSGPGEIVFRHMNVVQRGVGSPILDGLQ
jgi:hypothetical protein